MPKHPFRRIIFGFLIFMLVITIGYFSYTSSIRNSLKKTSTYPVQNEETVSAAASTPLSEEEILKPDCYYVRYDGKELSVYAVSNNKEEFLYTIKTRIADISDNELESLKKGVYLKDKQALTAFEEDFTS